MAITYRAPPPYRAPPLRPRCHHGRPVSWSRRLLPLRATEAPGLAGRSLFLPQMRPLLAPAPPMRATEAPGFAGRFLFLPQMRPFHAGKIAAYWYSSWSHYNFLEEAKTVADSAQRMRQGLCGNVRYRLPLRLQLLRKAAGRRRTHVLILSNGMTRREKNQSRFDQKKNSIFWTVEWQLHSINLTLVDHGVDEHVELASAFGKYLKHGPFNNRLRPYCKEQLDNIKFFIKKNPKGPKAVYRELDRNAHIGRQLSGLVIVEYPTIHVYLPSDKYDFEVEPIAVPKSEPAKHVEDQTSPEGVPFREEEIEEEQDNSSNTEVLDLMKYMNPGTVDNFHVSDGEKEVKHTDPEFKGNHGVSAMQENDGYFTSHVKGYRSDDMAFEFQQDLKDAYSGLFREVNPDDFLCMDDELVREEDLEEGEIVE